MKQWTQEEYDEIVAGLESGKRVVEVNGRTASTVDELHFALAAGDAEKAALAETPRIDDLFMTTQQLLQEKVTLEAEKKSLADANTALQSQIPALEAQIKDAETDRQNAEANRQTAESMLQEQATQIAALTAEKAALEARLAEATAAAAAVSTPPADAKKAQA